MNRVRCLPFSRLGEEKSLDNKVCNSVTEAMIEFWTGWSVLVLFFAFNSIWRGCRLSPQAVGVSLEKSNEGIPRVGPIVAEAPEALVIRCDGKRRGRWGGSTRQELHCPPLPRRRLSGGGLTWEPAGWVGCLRPRTPAGVGVACRGNREIGSWASPASRERCGTGEQGACRTTSDSGGPGGR